MAVYYEKITVAEWSYIFLICVRSYASVSCYRLEHWRIREAVCWFRTTPPPARHVAPPNQRYEMTVARDIPQKRPSPSKILDPPL